MVTLAKLGYSRTSLREIAQNSDFSHGVVHYYFTDKADLIAECVACFRAQCDGAFVDLLAQDDLSGADFRSAVVDRVVAQLREYPAQHRIWYDLRTQTMFEPSLRDEVDMLHVSLSDLCWRVVSRYAELVGGSTAMPAGLIFSMLEGRVQRALTAHLYGDENALPLLQLELHDVFDLAVTTQPRPVG